MLQNLNPVGSTGQLVFDNGRVSEWLSSKDAAAFLCISPNALRILVCREKIQAYKLGRRLRFRLRDLKSALVRKGA